MHILATLLHAMDFLSDDVIQSWTIFIMNFDDNDEVKEIGVYAFTWHISLHIKE